MNQVSPGSDKAGILKLLEDESYYLDRKLMTNEIEAKFDRAFIQTDIEVNLLGQWSAIAYRPQKGSGNSSWGYKVFNRHGLQDCGLVSLEYPGSINIITPQEQREIINFITDITESNRDWGYVPLCYATSLMRASSHH